MCPHVVMAMHGDSDTIGVEPILVLGLACRCKVEEHSDKGSATA